MINKVLIITDLHLTEKPDDEYRWEVFPWSRKLLRTNKLNALYILGDLFDKKDRHPSELVNRLTNEIGQCQKLVPVTILKGNHDYLKPDHPFLAFLEWMPAVDFIQEPFMQGRILFLPHSKNPEKEWKPYLNDIQSSNLDFIFLHQSIIGSVVSNYHEMKTGLSPAIFKGTKAKIISGDIHVPQDISIRGVPLPLTYIGTQYPIAFGDTYKPRAIVLDMKTKEFDNVYLNTIQKLHLKISHPEDLINTHLNPGDQIKITLQLTSAELTDWPQYKKEIQRMIKNQENVLLKDIKLEKIGNAKEQTSELKQHLTKFSKESPDTIIKRYAENEKLDPKIIEAGIELITNENPATD